MRNPNDGLENVKKFQSRGTQTEYSYNVKQKKKLMLTRGESHQPRSCENIFQRSEKFKCILNGTCDDSISTKTIFYSFSGVLLGIVLTSTVTLLPQHNVINNPEYWYESMITLAIGFPAAASGYIAYNYFYCLNMSVKEPWKIIISIFIVGMLTSVILSSTCYLVWSRYFLFPYPIPFQGYLVGNGSWSAMTIASWFLCPSNWRKNVVTKIRLRYCILLSYVMSFIEISYKVFAELFIWIPLKYQWCLAVLLIIARECNIWILSRIVRKISGFDDISTNMIATHFSAARHALFISLVIGSMATNETSYFLLGVDFLANLYLCLRIIYLNGKLTEKHKKEKMETIQTLVINETVESLMPIAYCIIIIIAYYGPSGQVIGNIKNSYWQYSAINNMENTIQWLSIFFLVDFMSVVVSIILLLTICNINLVKIYCQLQSQSWHILALHQAYLLVEVC